jgi:hypothetical protein
MSMARNDIERALRDVAAAAENDSPDFSYRLRLTVGHLVESLDALSAYPPVLIRNRPKRIIFNTGHPAHAQGDRARKYSVSLALELAYLRDSIDVGAFYEQMIDFLEVL